MPWIIICFNNIKITESSNQTWHDIFLYVSNEVLYLVIKEPGSLLWQKEGLHKHWCDDQADLRGPAAHTAEWSHTLQS